MAHGRSFVKSNEIDLLGLLFLNIDKSESLTVAQ